MKSKLSAIVAILLFTACSHYKDIPYFQNASEVDLSNSAYLYDMKIKTKDQLSIYIFAGLNGEAASQFKTHIPPVIDFSKQPVSVRGSGISRAYIVENDGCIDYPIVGKIHLAGLTIDQANKLIKEKIAPHIQKDVDYVVNTVIRNYEVTVMGEVNRPNTFTTDRNKMTVLEALSMAGDMTIYGKRDCVKILREKNDGEYEVHELDMRDANILNSPYYYLEQRDIVYVEPNEVRAQNAKVGRTTQLWLRGTSITLSLGSLLYRILDN